MLTKFRFCLWPVGLNVTGALSHCSKDQKPKRKQKIFLEKIVFFKNDIGKVADFNSTIHGYKNKGCYLQKQQQQQQNNKTENTLVYNGNN